MNEKNRKLCDYAHGVRCPYCGSTVSLHDEIVPFEFCTFGAEELPPLKYNVWRCDNLSCGADVRCVRDTTEPQGMLQSGDVKTMISAVNDICERIIMFHCADSNVFKTMVTELIIETIDSIGPLPF